jgi:hypothetical protein
LPLTVVVLVGIGLSGLQRSGHLHVFEVRLNRLGVRSCELAEELDGLIGLSELFMEHAILLLEFLDQSHLGVIVLNRFVRYVGGLARVLEGVDVLLNIHIAWVQTGDHQAVAISTQAVPEE